MQANITTFRLIVKCKIAVIIIEKGRIDNDPTFFLINIRTEEFLLYMGFLQLKSNSAAI